VLRHARDVALLRHPSLAPFDAALRARTPRVVVTPVLVGLHTALFVLMAARVDSAADPGSLIAWGANFGPRTANGEWWRLFTSVFLHTGLLHLLVSIIGLVQIGVILERLVGSMAVATVYLVAGGVSSAVSVSALPIATSAGASGAIFGLYGLLLAASVWGVRHRSPIVIPWSVVASFIPAATVFALYSVASEATVIGADVAGLLSGAICGLVATRQIADRKPSGRFVVAEAAATLLIAAIAVEPLRGIVDVRPEIGRVIEFEYRSARDYRAASARFREGTISAEALATVIDRSILPEMTTVRQRLEALGKVPPEHEPAVTAIRRFLSLREESWQLRSQALHEGKMITLRRADEREQAARALFEGLRPPSP
jgi:membrane associated rhomboid family serine protease